MKKAALYNPYLQTLGGGERLILSILQVLDENGYEITIFWDIDLSDEIETRLGLVFKHLVFKPNIFAQGSAMTKLSTLKDYDMFFYVTDGSYFFSSAKKNFVYSMVPDKKLYNRSPLNLLKLSNYEFITISEFSKKCLSSLGIPSKIIYPYLPSAFFEELPQTKEKIIFNVGRFFRQLHAKRQDVAIKWFQELKKQYSEYEHYKLILAGSVLPEDEEYLNELKSLAGEDPSIEFHTNESFEHILALYNKAEYYWHFAGFEVDEEKHPEQTEHLGITPMEAMARGCITCAYRAGGPKEIIHDGDTGYLFSSQEELFEKMKTSKNNRSEIVRHACDYVQTQFTYEAFQKRVCEVLDP